MKGRVRTYPEIEAYAAGPAVGGKGERMCGGSFTGREARLGTSRAWEYHGVGRRRAGRTGFFGLDVEEMRPGVQVAMAMALLVPVLLSGLLLVAFVPGLWWVFTTYGWISFPALGLLARGIAGLSDGRTSSASEESRERELLRALREHGELTPTLAAMQTSLSVAEADEMLRGLAEGGHLEVRVRGGALYYALWARPAAIEGSGPERGAR